MLRQDDWMKSQLVNIGWAHGKVYGGYIAANMIMSTIMNRVRAGWGGARRTLVDVLNDIPRTSATLSQPIIELPQSMFDESFIHLLHDVEGIYAGSSKDLSNGAMYWGDVRNIDNPWFVKKIMEQPDLHPRVAEMGTLWFYR